MKSRNPRSDKIQAVLENTFNVSLWTLSPLVVVIAMVVARQPAFVAIISGALFGGIVAVGAQPDLVLAFAAEPHLPTGLAMLEAVWRALSSGFEIETGIVEFDRLLSRGGMASMLNTVWLILVALAFGAVLERNGMIQALLRPLISFAKNDGSAVLCRRHHCLRG